MSRGRYSAEERAAVAREFRPQSEQELDALMHTVTAQFVVLSMRWRGLWQEASKIIRRLGQHQHDARWKR